jgi:hypothetical protein
MSDKDSKVDKIEGIKGIMGSMLTLQRSLKYLVPEYNWTGNPLGDFGEFVAIEHYSLKKWPTGNKSFDAKTADGKTVSIKANHKAKQIGIRGKADLLLVIHVAHDGNWEEVYYGDHKEVIEKCNWSSRDSKHVIGITKLKKMQEAKKKQQEIEDE